MFLQLSSRDAILFVYKNRMAAPNNRINYPINAAGTTKLIQACEMGNLEEVKES